MNTAINAASGSVSRGQRQRTDTRGQQRRRQPMVVSAPTPPPLITHNGSVGRQGRLAGDDTFTSCTDRDTIGGSIGGNAMVEGASVTAEPERRTTLERAQQRSASEK